ncbi:hypothetical protein [Desulfosporosinus sp. FKA]|uniref:hypothetical protein n=1 Tax=Desulfosporosinus sp. FKA TaxID=1969834 RepID=UPI000B49ACD5|nr:hypothetical protein [Desulfosporosinus sp. FKA]
MKLFQLEQLYEQKGLDNYKLINTNDLLELHGINYRDVKGYENLDDINKKLYEKALINILNNFGLEVRNGMILTGINFVEEIGFSVELTPIEYETMFSCKFEESDSYLKWVVETNISIIGKSGKRTKLRAWCYRDKKFEHLIHRKTECNRKRYLRIDYKKFGRHKEWLHIISPTHFY